MSKIYSYTISKEASDAVFQKTCERIDCYLPQWTKKAMLTDVDGSLIQTYQKDGQSIDVFNDCEIDAVFVDAEIRLDDIFGAPVKVQNKD